MSSQRMQSYMDRHKLQYLFEELMNNVLRDMPDEPLIHILKLVYKKAGLDIPQDINIRASGVRKSTSDLARTRSPELGSKRGTKTYMSASMDPSMDRGYDKPWLKNTKRVKPKNRDESPTRTVSRKRTDWNPDTKVVSTFDDLWNDTSPVKGDHSPTKSMNTKHAWASIGLEGNENIYSSGGYTGPRPSRPNNSADPLAGEMLVVSSYKSQEDGENKKATKASSYIKGPGADAKKHRKRLEKLLNDAEKSSDDSGYIDDLDTKDPDAIELLEDASDLMNEGVTNVPKTGYRMSRSLKGKYSEEPKVKLNINLFPRPYSRSSDTYFEGGRYGRVDDYDFDEDVARPRSGFGQNVIDTDDEFESVSQVTGPRRPIWNVPDSDGETSLPKTSKSATFSTKQMHQMSGRSDKFLASAPAKFHDPTTNRSYQSGATFDIVTSKSWERPDDLEIEGDIPSYSERGSLHSRGGWQVPEDTETGYSHVAPGKQQRDYRAY